MVVIPFYGRFFSLLSVMSDIFLISAIVLFLLRSVKNKEIPIYLTVCAWQLSLADIASKMIGSYSCMHSTRYIEILFDIYNRMIQGVFHPVFFTLIISIIIIKKRRFKECKSYAVLAVSCLIGILDILILALMQNYLWADKIWDAVGG